MQTLRKVHFYRGVGSLLLIQCAYYLILGLWPITDIKSFMEVTGSTSGIGTIRTLALFQLVISLALARYLFFLIDQKPVLYLGAATAFAFMALNLYCVLKGSMSKVCLASAAVELCLLMNWIGIIVSGGRGVSYRLRKRNGHADSMTIERDFKVFSETKA
jgi:hypothetical protein